MGKLTEEQRNRLREFLVRQGLSFKPLRDEMADHITCDLEDRMSDGHSFQEAWNQSLSEIPDNHFQLIQKDVMETINKRFTWSQGLSFLAIGLILISTIFKVLHLQYAGELLLLSFVVIAASLLTASLNGISINKGKKGAIRVISMIVGIMSMLVGFGFKLLHLTGADEFILLAVTLLIASVVVNSLYVYQHASGEGNLLTYLHEKYTPGIERFFLLLLLPMVLYKVLWIITSYEEFVGNFVLLVVIFGAGLQLILLSWRIMEKDVSKKNALNLTAVIVCALCLFLVFLGPMLSLQLRIILITIFSIASAWLAWRMEEQSVNLAGLFMAGLVPALFTGWALIRLSIIPASSHTLFFNIPVILILTGGLLLCKTHGAMRTFMLVSLSAYVFEYIS